MLFFQFLDDLSVNEVTLPLVIEFDTLQKKMVFLLNLQNLKVFYYGESIFFIAQLCEIWGEETKVKVEGKGVKLNFVW